MTLVFTDIEGSTRLLDELGTDGYRDALAEHRRIVRDACSRYEGYEVDYEGDAFFYAFSTAQAAVNAVSEAMQGLDGGPIRIRVGIHTGSPALDPPKYIGIDVHRAARIMSAAHGGQVVLSRETTELLDGGIEMKDLGNHHLKDFDAPERIHQLGTEQHPPLKSLYRVSLPVPATPFLGRAHEVQTVVQLLADPHLRVLTLTGPGGTGKTRLAIQAAAGAADNFPDGVTWVPLASLRDPGLVVATIARALELGEEPGSPVDTVARALAGKRSLLLVDNLEHLLPEAAVVLAELVAACPTLRLLVTSRERLAVQGEHEHSVEPLGHDDAVDLLLARAGSFSVQLARDATASALVDRLDRLPLAIELAAARLKLLGPAALLDRLAQRLDSLRGGRDVDPRQQTLRATIAWSHDLLSASEQMLFRRMSVFRSACSLAAVEAICEAEVDDLQSLLDKSLVKRLGDGADPRFWMLETIREFAAEQLHESPTEHRTTIERHLEWFYELARPPDGYPWTATPARVDELDGSIDDFRATLERLVARPDVLRALTMAVDLFPLWEMRDRFVEGDRWLERALELPGCERAAERGIALDARASTAYHLRRPEECRRHAEAAVEILRGAGDPEQLAMALLGQSLSVENTDSSTAIALAAEGLELARSANATRTVRTILLHLGACAADLGDHARAERLLEEALELSRSLDDEFFVGACLEGLGDVKLDLRRNEEAWSLYLEAAERASARDARLMLGVTIGGLAAAAARLGDGPLSRRLWAAFEQWESERGADLTATRRARYAEAAAAFTDDETTGFPRLTLEEALAAARARGAAHDP